jgi:hypothetical protein
VSTKEQMQYLDEPQTLRNKDYITIKRSEYELFKSGRYQSQQLDLKEKRLMQLQIDLNKKEQELKKKEMRIKYDLHKKILDFARQFINT